MLQREESVGTDGVVGKILVMGGLVEEGNVVSGRVKGKVGVPVLGGETVDTT